MDTYYMTEKEEKKYKRNKAIVLIARISLFAITAFSLANIIFMLTGGNTLGLIAAFLPSYIADAGIVLTEDTGDAFYSVIYAIIGIASAHITTLFAALSFKRPKFLIAGFAAYAVECVFFLLKLSNISFPFGTAILPHIVFLAILIAGGFASEALSKSSTTKHRKKKAARKKQKEEQDSRG